MVDNNITQMKNQIQDLPPDQLIDFGATVVSQIGRLSKTHREEFWRKLDPTAQRLFEDQVQRV